MLYFSACFTFSLSCRHRLGLAIGEEKAPSLAREEVSAEYLRGHLGVIRTGIQEQKIKRLSKHDCRCRRTLPESADVRDPKAKGFQANMGQKLCSPAKVTGCKFAAKQFR